MFLHVFSRSRQILPISSLLRQIHIGGNNVSYLPSLIELNPSLKANLGATGTFSQSLSLEPNQSDKTSKDELTLSSQLANLSLLSQSRQGILDIPLESLIRPSIGIPPEMVRRSVYRTPLQSDIVTPIETPTISSNMDKEIEDSPNNPSRIEKQAARLIVIRRSKMNKHKLRKLRKKMKYVYAKVKLRRAIRKEKAYLNSKMELINAARAFDAKEYVAGIIKRAKEEPIPYKWQDPLMPEWFKEQEMKKEAWQKRYQKMINLYLNKGITIDWRDKWK